MFFKNKIPKIAKEIFLNLFSKHLLTIQAQSFLYAKDFLEAYYASKDRWVNNALATVFIIRIIIGFIVHNFINNQIEFYKTIPFNVGIIVLLMFSNRNTRYLALARCIISFLTAIIFLIILPDYIFSNSLSFIIATIIILFNQIILDPLGKNKNIMISMIALGFWIKTYQITPEKILCLIGLVTLSGLFFIHFLDHKNQLKRVEMTSYEAVKAHNNRKTSKMLKHLIYKPSILVDLSLEECSFISTTYANTFQLQWNDLISHIKVVEANIGHIIHTTIDIENLNNLITFLKLYMNQDLDKKKTKEIIGFISHQYLTGDPSSFTVYDFDQRFAPFLIKITLANVFDQHKIFIEFENCKTQLENLSIEKKIDKYKLNIMSSVSHDVKTPLTSILNYCQNFRSSQSFHELCATAKIIEQQILKVYLSVSAMMLNVKAVEQNELCSQDISCFGAHRLMLAICKLLDSEARGKNIFFNVVSDERFTIFNEKQSFIYINFLLLSNAITFSNGGEIIIEMKKIKSEEPPETAVQYNPLEISIIDQGVGMPPEIAKKINESNFSELQNNKSLQGGFVGLSCIQRLLKRISPIKSKLKVESEKGKGTKFTYVIYHRHPAGVYHEKNQKKIDPEDPNDDDDADIDLLFKNVERSTSCKINKDANLNSILTNGEFIKNTSQESIGTSIQPSLPIEFKNLYVLIVDDVYFNVESLGMILYKIGLINQYKFVSSSLALNFLQNNPNKIDLIFVDYQMPEMNGYELLVTATEKKLLKNKCKSVLVTAANEISLTSFTGITFDAILHKPYSYNQLGGIILELMTAVQFAAQQKKRKKLA